MRARTWWMVVALLAAAGCGGDSPLSAEADLEDDAGDGIGSGGSGQGANRACGYGPPCDASNLGRQTCETLGLRPGVLSCDPDTCFLVLDGCGPGGLTSEPTGTGAGTGEPLPEPALFGGGSGATDGGLFGGGLFGAQPTDGGVDDEDGGTDDPGGGPGGGFVGGAAGNGGFFGGGFFGGGAGTGGGLFGGGLFGGGAGTGGTGASE